MMSYIKNKLKKNRIKLNILGLMILFLLTFWVIHNPDVLLEKVKSHLCVEQVVKENPFGNNQINEISHITRNEDGSAEVHLINIEEAVPLSNCFAPTDKSFVNVSRIQCYTKKYYKKDGKEYFDITFDDGSELKEIDGNSLDIIEHICSKKCEYCKAGKCNR